MVLGDGSAWDESSPNDTTAVKDGDDEIRDLRVGTRLRIEKEHIAPAGSSAGGEHKAGSAVAYYQSSAPTTKPDGSTSLDSDDNGRLWIDSDDQVLYHYVNGSGFVQVGGNNATQALDNLASVAINTSLISDTNNTDDLGSASIGWKDIYFEGNLVANGNTVSSANLATLTNGSNAQSLHVHGWDYNSGWVSRNVNTLYTLAHGISTHGAEETGG